MYRWAMYTLVEGTNYCIKLESQCIYYMQHWGEELVSVGDLVEVFICISRERSSSCSVFHMLLNLS